jgi:hypothetical protein
MPIKSASFGFRTGGLASCGFALVTGGWHEANEVVKTKAVVRQKKMAC